MAEDNRNIFQRLSGLFRSNIVIRKTPQGQLKIKDLDMSQVALTNNFIDRYSKLMKNTYGKFANNQNPSYSAQRIELFKDYELMDTDPIISSALDIYSDESTVDNIEGEILTIKTDNAKLYKILHNLF